MEVLHEKPPALAGFILGVCHFSRKDRKGVMSYGKLLIWPKAHYLVIGVKDGKVYDTKSFIWNEEQKDFVEEEI